MATRLNLVVIRSSDMDAAARFYETLGLKFSRHSHGSGPIHYASLDTECVFEIYPLRPGEASTVSTRLGFQVESVDGVLGSLQTVGGKLISAPKESPWGYRAVIEDLDGHHVEISAPVPPPCDGLRRAFGSWADDADELDQFLDEIRSGRKRSRSEIET
ncbi:MAG: VOC family protein [Pirellulales bacterium]